MPINSFLYPGPSNSNPYLVDNSCRFNDGDSASLTKSVSGTSQTTAGTISFWFKRGVLSTNQRVWINYVDANNYGAIKLQSDNKMEVVVVDGGSVTGKLVTNRLFKDCSAWYHCCVAINSSDGTAGNRMRLYINGTEETSFATDTNPSSGATMEFFTDGTNKIGQMNSDQYFDGYIAEFVMIHGSQLTPSSFGEFDSDSPTIWKPKAIALTFGSKDYYLDFKDSGDLGDDESGQGNDFTENNLAATDQSTDTCTNNFCTWNGVEYSGDVALSEGNLQGSGSDADDYHEGARGTMAVSSGKWYWEVKAVEVGDTSNIVIAGIMSADHSFRKDAEDELLVGTYGMRSSDGKSVISSGSALAYATWGAAFVDGDILNFALDMDNNRLYIGKGGSWADGSGNIDEASINAYLSLSTTPSAYMPMVIGYSTGAAIKYQANFGNAPYSISSGNADANGYGNFEYSVPSGYYALNTKNLAEYG